MADPTMLGSINRADRLPNPAGKRFTLFGTGLRFLRRHLFAFDLLKHGLQQSEIGLCIDQRRDL
jgi:hypothetical protein